MAKIHWKTKFLSKEDKKKVRDFIKPYETDDLTIIFADNWKQKVHDGKRYKQVRPKASMRGFYCPIRNGHSFGFGGVRTISFPWMAINATKHDWYSVFLHEFGHYIDDKTNGGIKKHQRVEAFANTFAELAEQW